MARTGLLDGRSATTHFARADRLQGEFAGLRVESQHAYIDHGDVATSAGAGAGLELCLHLVRRDHGPGHAALLARHMALPQPSRPSFTGDPGDLAGLLAWADERLADPLSMADLAAHLGVSQRTLARRFAGQLGTSPGAWLLARRVAAARTLLEQTDLPVEAIAVRVDSRAVIQGCSRS